MSATAPPAGFLTRTASAERLGWYPQRLSAAVRRGEIAAFELNGRILLRETDVDAFAATLAVDPTPLDLDPLV